MLIGELPKIITLMELKLNLERNGFNFRGLSILKLLYKLPFLENFCVNFSGNDFKIFREMLVFSK
jgi:hypothetical protein